MTTDTDTDALEDDLFKVAEQTTADGRVEVQITEVRDAGSHIVVGARLPHGEVMTEDMRYPERDSREYKFVRLVERTGLSLSAIGELDDAWAEAENNRDVWQFYAPEETTRRERIASHHQDMISSIVSGLRNSLAAVAISSLLMISYFIYVDSTHFDTASDVLFIPGMLAFSIFAISLVGWVFQQ